MINMGYAVKKHFTSSLCISWPLCKLMLRPRGEILCIPTSTLAAPIKVQINSKRAPQIL